MKRIARVLLPKSQAVSVRCFHCTTDFTISTHEAMLDVTCPACGTALITAYSQNFYDSSGITTSGLVDRKPAKQGASGSMQFGHFRLLSEAGSGSSGKVFRSLNCATGRLVAIKILFPALALSREERLPRLLRGANVARALRHPHIVDVLEVGTIDDIPFMEMEYLRRGSLVNLVQKKGALPWRKAVRLTCDVLDALSAAHRANVVHRDLSPSNVLLTDDGKAKLGDFELCRILDGVSITARGTVLGSPLFMAPEQWKDAQVGPRADIYAAGHLLYYLLTGGAAFQSGTMLSVMYKHLHVEVPEIEGPWRETPAFLSDIIRKATAKEPSGRFETAEHFRQALAHVGVARQDRWERCSSSGELGADRAVRRDIGVRGSIRGGFERLVAPATKWSREVKQ